MRNLLKLILTVSILVFAGCGGGNNGAGGLNGSLTVEASQAEDDYSSDVSFTITYTNPFRDDLIGVPLNYAVYLDGVVVDNVATNFNNSGKLKVTYSVDKTSSRQSLKLVAKVGNLYASNAVTVSAFGDLNVTPSFQTFSETELTGTIKTFTISGGSGNYSVASSNAALVSVTLTGTTINAQREADTAGTVNITVTDTTTGESILVQAICVAP